MFVNSHGTLALLEPKDYYDLGRYEAEQQSLRARSWYWVGLRGDLTQPGQYCARVVAGVPIVVWNQNGKIRAYKNICLHRHSQVVKDGPGRGSVLRCQYHGWEYGGSGKLKHMPDAESFAGIPIPVNCLSEYEVEILGDFVLVALEKGVLSLRQSLKGLAADLDHFYSDQYLFYRQSAVLNVNWKLVLEIAVENYHVPMVHPNFFKNYHPPEVSEHRIGSHYTSYLDLRSCTGDLNGLIYLAMTRILCGLSNPKRLTVTHVFPNFYFFYGDLFSVATYVEAVGPERSVIHSHCYFSRQIRFPFCLKPIRFFLEKLMKRQFLKIFSEDNQILLHVQAGVRHASDRAVLSLREERIHAFHFFLKTPVQT